MKAIVGRAAKARVKQAMFRVKQRDKHTVMREKSLMVKVRYVGLDQRLRGCTALGRYNKHGHFMVQIDQLDSDWSHHWHVTNPRQWQVM